MEDLILNGKGGLNKVTWVVSEDRLTIQDHMRNVETTLHLSDIRSLKYSPPNWKVGGQIKIDYGAPSEGIVGVTSGVALSLSGEEYVIFKKADIPTAEAIRDYINNYRTTHASPQQAPSLADELVKLKGLLDAGALTQEEFEAVKSKLIFD